jgi:polyvinyl alcohol dehydrogenase (cytochrome)
MMKVRVPMALAGVVASAALAAPAQAAEQQAYAAGLNYVTPAVVAGKGDTLRLTNLDPIAQHDLDSDAPGLFSSPLVGAGQSTPVTGVQSLPPGSYPFHCSLHAWMHGVLTVANGGGAPGPPPPGGTPGGPDTPNPADLLPKAPAEPLGAGEWPVYGKDLANSRNGGEAGPSYNEVPNLAPVWSFQSKDGDFTGTPVVARGTLVVGSFGGTVFALDAATGKRKWSRDLLTDAQEQNASINGSAAIAGDLVYVPLARVNGPQLVALSRATGTVVWRADLDTQKGSDVFGSPVAWNHKVYMGVSAEFGEVNDPKVAVRGSVQALDATTGARAWKTYTVPPGSAGGAVWSTPAVDPSTGRVYVGTGNAYQPPAAGTTDSILALSAATGKIAGHFQATSGDVWNESGRVAEGPDDDFGASPNLFVDTNGKKLVGEGQKSGTYWAVDRGTMKPVWNAITGPPGRVVGGIVGSTAFDGKRIYGPDTPGGEIWSLGPDGAPAWFSSDAGPLQFNPVAVANGVVYSSSMSGFITAREATTGAILAKLPLGAPTWGGVAIAGGSVFGVTGTQNTGGWVVAYRPRG